MSTKHWIELGLALAMAIAWLGPWLSKKARELSKAINEIDQDNQR